MSDPTRLDVVVRLRERKEGAAQLMLAQAMRSVNDAESALSGARAKAAQDARQSSSAGEWLIAEEAHRRALVEVRTAQVSVERAKVKKEQARSACEVAHQSTEIVRRAADRKRDEQRLIDSRAERKQDDSLALLLRAG